MKKLLKTLLAASAVIAISAPAQAGGLPTFDVVSMTQKIVELENLIDTVQNTQAQVNSISGIRNMGDLFNTEAEQAFRTHMPSTFNEVLDLASDTGKAATFINDIRDTYGVVDASDIYENPNSDVAVRYQRGVDYAVNTMAISQSAYEVASMRNQTLAALQAELNQTTDLKASVDLQSRILIEQSYIQNEAIRLQALALQGQADEKASIFEAANQSSNLLARPQY